MTAEDLRAQRLRAYAVMKTVGRTQFKPETSAQWVDIARDWTGRTVVRIEHDTIKGCSGPMMRWWFENLAASTTWNGTDFSGPEVSHYHLWHHRDHISVTPINSSSSRQHRGFAVGAETIIREQFNDHHERIRARVITTRLDDHEFTFHIKRFGLTVGSIVHRYHDTNDGLRFYAETQIGSTLPILGPILNWLIAVHIYSKTTAEHWIKHNIEETGQTEAILPVLYRAAHPHTDQAH